MTTPHSKEMIRLLQEYSWANELLNEALDSIGKPPATYFCTEYRDHTEIQGVSALDGDLSIPIEVQQINNRLDGHCQELERMVDWTHMINARLKEILDQRTPKASNYSECQGVKLD